MFVYFRWASIVYGVLSNLAAATCSPLVPLTVEMPNGTTQHGSSRILCPPTNLRTMATFFLGNFVAHIATIKSVPGEKLPVTVCNVTLALLFPTSGLMRGLNAMARGVRFGVTELDKACRAGALCVVVRNSTWRPRTNDSLQVVLATRESSGNAQIQIATNAETLSNDDAVENDTNNAKREFSHQFRLYSQAADRQTVAAFKIYHPTWLKENQRWWIFFDTVWGRTTVNTLLFDIHGTYRLPRGYSFAILPRNTIVVPRISNSIDHGEIAAVIPSLTTAASPPLRIKRNSDIASSGSVLKILASIFQLLFAYYTVYRHHGGQVQRWGYVSFFFTPLPYAIMSFCNGISNLLTPDYATLYMVHSETMDEAIEAGGAFEGVVGRIIPLVGPVNDNGYGSGFATTWKGISPTSIKRAVWTAFVRVLKQQTSPMTMRPATCTAVSKGVDNSYLLQMRSGENEVCSIYKVSSISASDEGIFDSIFKSLKGEPFAQLRSNTLLWVYFGLNYCIRHPHRAGRSLKKWNRNPRLPIRTLSPLVSFSYGIFLLIWSVFHPQHARRKVQQWFGKLRTPPGSKSNSFTGWYRKNFGIRALRIKQPDQITQTTVYHRSCSRFQRYDDPIPQKNLAAAIMNSTHVVCATATSEINYPSASSPRSITDITWSSALLPIFFGLFISCVPIIIVDKLSQFQPGSSSLTQRIIIPLWWSSGSILGLLMPLLDVTEILVYIVWLPAYLLEKIQIYEYFLIPSSIDMNSPPPSVIVALAFLPWSVFVAPVWGFVIVGQMLNEWGSCISLY